MAQTTRNSKTQTFRNGLGSRYPTPEEARAAAFEQLYRESYPTVYGRVLFRMRDTEAARDVTAEAFLRAARYFDRFDPSKSKFSTWVNAIVNNCITDYYRKNEMHAPIDSVPESALADNTDHAQRIADADLARRLLEKLDSNDREIVFMKFCEGRTNSEIARILDMNPSTVATRVQRALAKMRASVV